MASESRQEEGVPGETLYVPVYDGNNCCPQLDF